MIIIDKQGLRADAVRAGGGKWIYIRTLSLSKAYITEETGSTVINCTDGDVPAKCVGFLMSANPANVLALLDELEAKDKRNAELNSTLERWAADRAQSASDLEAAEKRIAELTGQKRLIGWRMADYTDETADPALAKNWATAVDVLPIFEGDVNTKISSAAAGKGE